MQKIMYFSIFINNDIQMFSHILLFPWLLPLGIAPLFTDFSTIKKLCTENTNLFLIIYVPNIFFPPLVTWLFRSIAGHTEIY